jgi:putative resolvase
MQDKLVPIAHAARVLGVSVSTMRRWEREGRLLPDIYTLGGQRRYSLVGLRKVMAQARVSQEPVLQCR